MNRAKMRTGDILHTFRRTLERVDGDVRNLFARKPVTGAEGVIVSLTSHGRRLRNVHHTIESIAAGHVKPSRFILAVDSEADYRLALASPQLKRLRRRGLEILRSEPVGSHAKYYPFVMSQTTHRLPLVTADDDILYPRRWLLELLTAWRAQPDVIHCFRAHRFTMNGQRPALYSTWPPVADSHPSHTSFLTGVSGVIYPPTFLDELRSAADGFRAVAPKADDVWLNARAVSGGFRVSQLSSQPQHFAVLIGSQATALWRHNTDPSLGEATANDVQIASSYTSDDLARIVGDASGTGSLD